MARTITGIIVNAWLNIYFEPYFENFGVVNSCNGLLCLCHPSNRIPLVICNPLTGEFIRLPKATNRKLRTGVIKMWIRHVKLKPALDWVFEHVILEINTLGEPSWRDVEVDPQISFSTLKYPTYVNGALHWIRFEGLQKSILCFCFETERLQSFASPPDVFGIHGEKCISMGELKGFLYICDWTLFSDVKMWIMNEYGIGESWTKVYIIDTWLNPSESHFLWLSDLCFPIKHFEEGAAILLYHRRNYLIFYEPEKYNMDSKFFKFMGLGLVQKLK